MTDRSGTRVARTAAFATGVDQDTVAVRLGAATVLIEAEASDHATELCLFAAVRQAVLIWKQVTVRVPPDAARLVPRCLEIARALRPGEDAVRVDEEAKHDAFAGVLHVGPTTFADPRVVSVTSTGWVIHLFAIGTPEAAALPRLPVGGPRNDLAAIGASAIGVGEVFLRIVGGPRGLASFDLSLFDYRSGPLRTLPLGPELNGALQMEGLLVGAGTVSAGFAFALSPLKVEGRLDVIDHDAGRSQNFGPHLYISTATNGTAKVDLLKTALESDHPGLQVQARPERLRLFTYRIGREVPPPAVVISGLDKARPRHQVQRLWAPLHIDMATKNGIQVQVMVHTVPGVGACLIDHFKIGDEEDEEAEIARRTGLSAHAIGNELGDITDEDVVSAPPERREELEAARARGERRCNVITRSDLGAAADNDEYLGSAPFSALLAGVFAAGELIKAQLLGLDRDGTIVQWHFVSRNVYVDRTRCVEGCECVSRRTTVSDRLVPELHPRGLIAAQGK